MQIKVKSNYRSPYFSGRRGETYTLDDSLARWLLQDSPDSFEVVQAAPAGPPADKMIRAPARSKAPARMTVAELKTELRNRDLPISGNKSELVARLEWARQK